MFMNVNLAVPLYDFKQPLILFHQNVLNVIPYQLLEGGLVQVALQGEVAEGLPGGLVGLHLHRIPLHAVVVPDRTACHQGGACHALQVLQEERKTLSSPQILANDAVWCKATSG